LVTNGLISITGAGAVVVKGVQVARSVVGKVANVVQDVKAASAAATPSAPKATASTGAASVVTSADDVGVASVAKPAGGNGSTGAAGSATSTAAQDAKAGATTTATAAEEASTVPCAGTACFVAGTLVQTSTGPQAIETFVGGEMVYSRHEHTQEMGLRPVIATKQTHDQALFEVVIQNAQGQTETLHTTAEHPFWVTNAQGGAQWLKASLLAADMQLIDHSGNTLTVQSQTALNASATVYNIQVQGHSTYHVGAFGTWVHNANCCNVVNGADGGVATTTASAQNIATIRPLAQQLQLESANSPFTPTGMLTNDAISSAKQVPGLGPGELSNPAIPPGFGKYTTDTFQSSAGNFQVHFYKNPNTGEVLYGLDYKAVFNNMSGVPKK
jgi:filamentous hemagglutinin